MGPATGAGAEHRPWLAAPEPSGRAVAALVLAVLSFVALPLLPALAALLLAPGARRQVEASGGRLTGAGLVRAAVLVAWANVALCALLTVAVALLLHQVARLLGAA